MKSPALTFVGVAIFLLSGPLPAQAENEGLADLDQATEAKLTAESLEDLGKVIQLCEKAMEAGLDESNTAFAKQLYVATLLQRGSILASAIFDRKPLDPRWRRLRQMALSDLEQSVREDPSLVESHMMIARLQALPGGDRAKARQALDRAIELAKEDPVSKAKALFYRAALNENMEQRLSDFNQAVKLAPGDEEIVRSRGLLYLLLDKPGQALVDFDTALKLDDEQADTHEARGVALYLLKRYEEALASFDKAVELAPESPIAYMHRARIRALQGESKGAIGDLDQALKIDPENLAVLLLRARIYQQAGDTERAKADIEMALKNRPGLAPALELRAVIAAGAGEYDEAIADLEQLRKIAPKNPELLIQLGMLYAAEKKPKEAVENFTAAIAADPKSWTAYRGRADANLGIGNQAEAIADYEEARKLKSDEDGVLNNLAWVLATSPDEKLRDGKRAIELATEACRMTDYKQAHILSTLAAAYAETGDFKTAISWSTKAVELAGEDVKDQLLAELKSYEEKKPWRESQPADDEPEEKKDSQAEKSDKPAEESPQLEQSRLKDIKVE